MRARERISTSNAVVARPGISTWARYYLYMAKLIANSDYPGCDGERTYHRLREIGPGHTPRTVRA